MLDFCDTVKGSYSEIAGCLAVLVDYDMKIIYVPGKEDYLTDSLTISPSLEEEVGAYITKAAKGCSLLMLFKVLKGEMNIVESPTNL